MKVLTPTEYPQGSEAWLRARCGVITASRFKDARHKVGGLDEKQQAYVDAIRGGMSEAMARATAGYRAAPRADVIGRAIAGEDITKPGFEATRYAWLIAMETIAREPLDETFVTWQMRRGQELEPQAKRVYERRTGAWVEDVSLILTDDERFGYSADGFRDDDGLVEVKVPASPDKIGAVWESPETAHLEYIDQIDGGLWITRRAYCDLVIYCPWLAPVGKDLFVKRIYRNEARIEALEADLIAFMRLVDHNLEVLRLPQKMSGALREEPQVGEPPPWVDAETTAVVETIAPTKPVAKPVAAPAKPKPTTLAELATPDF